MSVPDAILKEMNKQLKRIETCINLLSEEQIWYRYKPNINSIGNLCLHLAGNEFQHFVSGIGKEPFDRERSREFTSNNSMQSKELIELLYDVRRQSSTILNNISESDLTECITIHYSVEDWNTMIKRNTYETDSNYSKNVQTILIQVCEHYSYHTGQIVLMTKLLSDSQENITETYH